MPLNPKKRFNANKDAADFHASIADKDHLHAALEAALCQMEVDMPPMRNPVEDFNFASQMAGAKKFIATFLNLTSKEEIERKKDPTDLKY